MQFYLTNKHFHMFTRTHTQTCNWYSFFKYFNFFQRLMHRYHWMFHNDTAFLNSFNILSSFTSSLLLSSSSLWRRQQHRLQWHHHLSLMVPAHTIFAPLDKHQSVFYICCRTAPRAKCQWNSNSFHRPRPASAMSPERTPNIREPQAFESIPSDGIFVSRLAGSDR